MCLVHQEIRNDWYVAYTFPKSEKKAFQKLRDMGVEAYLPLHYVVRKWSDRKKRLEVPLFPNYLFIYTSCSERYEILKMRELVRYVSFGGKPATVSETMINTLKRVVTGNVEVDNEEFSRKDMPIKIVQGPFAGVEGILIRKNGKTRLVIQIQTLQRAISVDISAGMVTPLHSVAGAAARP